MSPRRRGFTLVEAVVAAAVGALVLAGIYETLAASSRSLKKGEAGLAANLHLQRILEQLRADLSGPWPWNPCTFPAKELRKLGYEGGDGIAFALERRRIERWATPYRDHEGPSGPTRRAVAGPIRELVPMAPCKVSWTCPDSTQPIWIGPGLGLPGTENLKGVAPFSELVPLGRAQDAPWILVLGPAFWSWDPARKKLLRWDEADGFHDPGDGQVVELELAPIEEWSADYLSKLPIDQPILQSEKQLLRVRIGLARTDERTPLVFTTTLARETGCPG